MSSGKAPVWLVALLTLLFLANALTCSWEIANGQADQAVASGLIAFNLFVAVVLVRRE